MKPAWLLTSTLTLGAALTMPASAQATDGSARIRYVEPGLSVQGALEPAPSPGVPNLLWLPGDRAWTDNTGRAEVQFPEGSVLQFARNSKLDFMEHDAEEGRSLIAVRLWTGSVYLIVPGRTGGPAFEIETPDGVVYVQESGIYRVDVISGETRVSVFRGTAEISSASQRVALYSGERSYLQPGRAPETAERFDHQSLDAFDAWSRSRQDSQTAYAPPDLPTEVQPYAAELAQYGSWSVIAGVGNVWSPRVSAGWQPYAQGRWASSPRGWAWVGSEPWGWAPYHYGRWGHSAGLGWYWTPGSTWSGAWVSWSSGGGYVGWCPMGRHGRPVRVHHAGRRGGHYAGGRGAWQYARAAGMGARDLSRHRVRGNPGVHMRTLAANEQPRQRGRYAVSRSAFESAPRQRGRSYNRTSQTQTRTRAQTRAQAGTRGTPETAPQREPRSSTLNRVRANTRRAVEPQTHRGDVRSDSAHQRRPARVDHPQAQRRTQSRTQAQTRGRDQQPERRPATSAREAPRSRASRVTPTRRSRSGRETSAPSRPTRTRADGRASHRAPQRNTRASGASPQRGSQSSSASGTRSRNSAPKSQRSASERKARKREN